MFRDPYVLDFLGLPADFSEAALETAILREIETFLLELGSGFTFVVRQKRMSIGADDYYLDLLFFHRALRALVAIDLKLGRFDARARALRGSRALDGSGRWRCVMQIQTPFGGGKTHTLITLYHLVRNGQACFDHSALKTYRLERGRQVPPSVPVAAFDARRA